MKSGDLFPKTEALPGSLHAEWKRCGKPSCRCTRGELHGPYWYRRWRESHRQRRQYITGRDLERVKAELSQYQELHPPPWRIRQELTTLRRLMKEALDG